MFSVSDYKQAWLVGYPVNKNDYNFSAYSSRSYAIHFSTYISYTIMNEWSQVAHTYLAYCPPYSGPAGYSLYEYITSHIEIQICHK
jgi:hypothetical protein